jgi:hypothetical protein
MSSAGVRNGMTRSLSSWSIISLLVVAASACAPVAHHRAVIDVPDVENAIAVARTIDKRKDHDPPQGAPWFEVFKGSLPAIITAPHATEPFRQGKYRFSDGGATAGLAAALHEICGVTVIYTTYRSPSDPNFYDDNEFKARVGELIGDIKPVLLLDIHASHPYRPYDVDIGSMNGRSAGGDKSLVPDLIDSFKMEGLVNISLDWFAASANETVTKYASSKGVPSVQLEFSSTRMSPVDGGLGAHRFSQTIQALARFLGLRGLCARIDAKES